MSEENEGTVFGIDLGTTYSCISYIDDTGNAQIAENMEGGRTTPSVVYFASEDEVVVGQAAKDAAVLEPDRTVQFVKQLIGNSKVALDVDGKERSPEEISSYILKKVAKDAEQTTGYPVRNVTITVPAYFGDAERLATSVAGGLADLNVMGIVQEPVAAAVYYGCTKAGKDQTLLVYDLGGGTFDVTVMNVSSDGSEIQVVCSDGNHNLGGRLWDAQIVSYLADTFREETDYEDDFDEFAMQQFQDAAERYKQQLTTRQEVRVNLNVAGLGLQTTLTRETFESLTSALLDETIQLTAKTIENARSKGYEVEKILLVGGSTYMPQVHNALESNFPGVPRELNEPNEAVSKGAALVARNEAIRIITDNGQLTGERADKEDATDGDDPAKPAVFLPGSIDIGSITTTTIKLATTKSYGIEVIADGEDMIHNMIRKNIPMSDEGSYTHEQRFGTNAEGQRSVEVRIYENDEEDELTSIDGREPIKEATFELGEPMPAGSPIDVTFSLDKNGILDIVAVEPSSGRQCPIRIETGGFSADQIEEIKNGLVMNVE